MDQGSKAETLSLSLRYGTSQSTFFCKSSYVVLAYALFVDVLSSASRDHGGGSGILGRVIFRFRQMRVFSNAQDLPRQSRSAAPVLLAILVVGMVTSGAALTGIADLEAAPEMSFLKSF